jgi:hypothetical protein
MKKLIISVLLLYSSICYANKLVYDANNQYLGELMEIENRENLQVLKDNYLIAIVVDRYADHQYATVKHSYEFLYLSEDCTGQKYIRFYHFLPKLFYDPSENFFYTFDYTRYRFDITQSYIDTYDNQCSEPHSMLSQRQKLYPMVKVTNPPIHLPFKLPFSFIEKESSVEKEKITLQGVVNDLQVLSGKNQNEDFSFNESIHLSNSAPSFISFMSGNPLINFDKISNLFGTYEGTWTEGNNQGGMVPVSLFLEGNTIKTNWHNGYGGDITLNITPLKVIFKRENTTWNGTPNIDNDIIVTWNFSDNSYSKFSGGYYFINTSSAGTLSGYKK